MRCPVARDLGIRLHDALLRIAPDLGFPEVAAVGAWWNRQHNPEIDIVAKNDDRHAGIAFAGSITWQQTQPFGLREYNALVRDAHFVPEAWDRTEPRPSQRRSHRGLSHHAVTAAPIAIKGLPTSE